MKVGIDFHGVIDDNPEFFSELSKLFVNNGHEVHIITGEKDTPAFRKKLSDLSIEYTHLFSIVTYHSFLGTEIWYKMNNPYMEESTWDRSKADYCAREKIDLHVDDSEKYFKYFTTPYVLYTKGLRKKVLNLI